MSINTYPYTRVPEERAGYDLQIVTPRATAAVSLSEMKLHLRVEDDVTDDDAMITSLIKAATSYCEMYTRRTILETEYRMTFDEFPAGQWFYLPRSPLISVENIKYYDEDGTLQTLATSVYTVGAGISSPARIALAPEQEWPATETDRIEAVQVTFKTGETTPADTFQSAIKLLVGHWYEHREAVTMGGSPVVVPKTVDMILDGERIYEVP